MPLFCRPKSLILHIPNYKSMRALLTTLLFIMAASVTCRANPATATDSLSAMDTDAILEMAERYNAMNMFSEEASMLESMLRQDRDLNLTQRVRTLYGLAHSYYVTGDYPRSLANLFEVLKLEKPSRLAGYDAAARLILADIYVRFGSADKAAAAVEAAGQSLEKAALPVARRDEIRVRIARLWSSIHGLRGQWDKFLEAVRKAESLEKEPDPERRLLDYGIYFSNTGNPALAGRYYEQLISTRRWSYDKMAGYCNYAELAAEESDWPLALGLADEGLREMSAGGTDDMRASLMRIKGQALAATGDAAGAVALLEHSRALNDSIMQWHTSNSVLQACLDYEADFELQQQKLNERKHRRQMWLTGGAIFLAVATAAAACLIWRKSRRRLRYGESLEKLILQQRDSYDSRISHTIEDLEQKKRNLISLTLRMSQLNEVVENALSNLPEAIAETDARKRLETLRADVRRIGLNRDLWEMFDVVFEQTKPGFYQKLRQAHPDLTVGETRMCAYIIMNLSTKEIAVMTNRSARTIETVRYRLGKKINLPSGTTLNDYLRDLDSTPKC